MRVSVKCVMCVLVVFTLNLRPIEAISKGLPEQRLNYITPTIQLSEEEYPELLDDLDFENMPLALERQIRRFSKKSSNIKVRLGERFYSLTHLKNSLIVFSQLIQMYKSCKTQAHIKTEFSSRQCLQNFQSQLKRRFNLFKPKLLKTDDRYGQELNTHFTAYYTPTLKVSKKQSSEFPYPFYLRPKNEQMARSTRHQIDFLGRLKNQNLELFYAKDLFELYILQVEGGGKYQLPDGSGRYLSYAGTNKKPWRFISLYMREKGMIDNLSIASQREYLKEHPEVQEEVYASCPSYVYFKITESQPEGSDLVSLTNNRSIATDKKHYGLKGLLAFVKTKRLRPEIKDGEFDPESPSEEMFQNFSRFMIDQDTGGAIKGKARVDLYFGEDEYAARASQYVNHLGEVFFLTLKP